MEYLSIIRSRVRRFVHDLARDSAALNYTLVVNTLRSRYYPVYVLKFIYKS